MRDQSAPLLKTMLYISGEVFNLDELNSILDFPPIEMGIKGTMKELGKGLGQVSCSIYKGLKLDY